MHSTITEVLDQIDTNLPASVERLFDLLSIPSISTDPAHAGGVDIAADWLVRDLALICDTELFDAQTPAITTILRGLLGEEINIHGPDRDLHSAGFGGAAINPARVLARILSELHDDAGRTVLEMIKSRPTCEIAGMISGYTGAGFKTVLPAQASAEMRFRLVGTQDPLKLREAFSAFVRARLPEDCRVEFIEHGDSRASVTETVHPAFDAAHSALSEECLKPAAFVSAGGSIPLAGDFNSIHGRDSMLIDFARDDDRIHAPNEKYDLDSYPCSTRPLAQILEAVS